jgi:serine phosphatase RsbU (regulator of sigma subunit)
MVELSARSTDSSGTTARVLVVDDDPNINRLMQVRLRSQGYDVVSAASGDEALARLDEIAPDLMLLDVSMPGASGLDVLDHVRAEGRDVAVIMATAFGSERIAIDALRRGADDYLRKPFEPDEFRTVVERTTSRLLLRRQNRSLRRELLAELRRASEVQLSLLPQRPPAVDGFELAAYCLPARQVGGDFYDWQIAADGSLNLMLGDVMGKGMPAALLMATVRAAVRAVAAHHSPIDSLPIVDDVLAEDLERSSSFATLFLARLLSPDGDVTFVDAGHGLAFVARADGGAQRLEPRSLPLGVLPGNGFAAGSVTLAPGDALVLYSDGLPDARPDLRLDPEVLAGFLRGVAHAQEIVERLRNLVITGATALPDDLTLVALRRAAS